MTAWVAVAQARAVTEKVAGVDPGIIHPLAIAAGDQALLVSGRAVRAEEFLHLEDQKARQRKMATKRSPLRAKPGQARRTGSRRWKQLARSQRRAEARDRRVVKLAGNPADPSGFGGSHFAHQFTHGGGPLSDPPDGGRLCVPQG